MAEIKSALELALERTKDIKSDPEALRRNQAEQDGKRLFAKLRSGEPVDVAAAIKEQAKDRRAWYRQGLFDVVLANLSLPKTASEDDILSLAETVLSALVTDAGALQGLFAQVRQFFTQYTEDRTHLQEQLVQQFEPRIRQKEQQYQKQYGRAVQMDPLQDPEFVQVLQDHLGRLEDQYRGALDEVHGHLRSMFRA